MKKYLLFLLIFIFIFTGCKSEEEINSYMYECSRRLMEIEWNADYNTFTPDETTQFAKEYYDKEYLDLYLEDIEAQSGLYVIQDEKLTAHLISTQLLGFEKQKIDDIEYYICKLQVNMYIDNYEPDSPEDTYFAANKEYLLNYTMYFKMEGGKPKLSGYEYEPANEPFLPPSANNVPLDREMQQKLALAVKEYYYLRYNIDHNTFDAQKAYEFYKNNMVEQLLESEGLTLEYFISFRNELKQNRIITVIQSFDLGELPVNKQFVQMEAGTDFYYVVHTKIEYTISASNEYLKLIGVNADEIQTVTEMLCFIFEDGEPKIAIAEVE